MLYVYIYNIYIPRYVSARYLVTVVNPLTNYYYITSDVIIMSQHHNITTTNNYYLTIYFYIERIRLTFTRLIIDKNETAR